MTGSIQTKKGRKNYYAVINVYDDGKRKPKWIDTGVPIKGNNKRKADAKLNELLTEYNSTGIDLCKNMDFVNYIEQWLDTTSVSISPTTHDAYKHTLSIHIVPYFTKLKLKVRDVTVAHIQQYVNTKLQTISANTIRKHLANLSKCLDTAVKQNIIAYNPVKRIEMPRKVKFTGAKHYNEKQIEQLLQHSKGDPLEVVIKLTLFYGLRRSEVLGLKWDAISFEESTVTIKHTVVQSFKTVHMRDSTKNDSSYAVFPMPETLATELNKWRQEQQRLEMLQPQSYHHSDYICTHVNGSMLSPNYVSQHFKLLLKKCGMPHIRFHDLRHSAASYLKMLGFDLKDIQTWLRHKDIQTTMNIYTHLDLEAKSNIANKLEARLQQFGTATR